MNEYDIAILSKSNAIFISSSAQLMNIPIRSLLKISKSSHFLACERIKFMYIALFAYRRRYRRKQKEYESFIKSLIEV